MNGDAQSVSTISNKVSLKAHYSMDATTSTVVDDNLSTDSGWVSTVTGNGYDATNDRVGVGIAAPTAPIHIEAPDNTELMNFTVTGNEKWALKGASGVGADDYVSFGISSGNEAIRWHETGYVVKPKSSIKIKNALNKIFTNNLERNNFEKNSIRRFNQYFTQKKMAKSYVKLYRSILNKSDRSY